MLGLGLLLLLRRLLLESCVFRLVAAAFKLDAAEFKFAAALGPLLLVLLAPGRSEFFSLVNDEVRGSLSSNLLNMPMLSGIGLSIVTVFDM